MSDPRNPPRKPGKTIKPPRAAGSIFARNSRLGTDETGDDTTDQREQEPRPHSPNTAELGLDGILGGIGSLVSEIARAAEEGKDRLEKSGAFTVDMGNQKADGRYGLKVQIGFDDLIDAARARRGQSPPRHSQATESAPPPVRRKAAHQVMRAEDKLIVTVELPGAEPEVIALVILRDTLHVTAATSPPMEAVIELPFDAESLGLEPETAFLNGVLTLHFPAAAGAASLSDPAPDQGDT